MAVKFLFGKDIATTLVVMARISMWVGAQVPRLHTSHWNETIVLQSERYNERVDLLFRWIQRFSVISRDSSWASERCLHAQDGMCTFCYFERRETTAVEDFV